jgi:hypothetical protein
VTHQFGIEKINVLLVKKHKLKVKIIKTLDSELTLQVENVKSNVKAADVVLKPVVEEEEDDLPF